MEGKTYLTVHNVAQILHLTTPRVRQLADAGKLPSIKTVSGWRLFDADDVERFAEARRAVRQAAAAA